MAPTTSDRSTNHQSSGDGPRIDESVFAAISAIPTPVGVPQFCRWFACFATAGREE